MDYYYAPMACSFAGHLLIREAEMPIDCVAVSLRTGQCEDGAQLPDLNSKALVPVLRMSDGRLLTENIAVLCALADMAPERGYLPSRECAEGLSTLEWLSFVATEIHKLCLYPIFHVGAPEASKSWARGLLSQRMAVAAERLREQPWLAGEQFTIADAYFGWALMLCRHAGFDIHTMPTLSDAWQRFMQRPAFAQTIADEQRKYRELS